MIDKWTHHVTCRISPEAPVPIIKLTQINDELGGAGNALRHLSNLSTTPHELVAVIGNDSAGKDLIRLGEKGKTKIHWVTDDSRKTTIKERFYLDDELKFRLDNEDLFEISEEIETILISKIDEVIDGFDVILLSDYAKGVLSRKLVKEIMDRAKKHELPIVTDPGFGRIEIFAGCSVIKPNQKEWDEYVGKKESEKIAIADLFSQGTGNILITQGSLGLRLITPTLDVQVRSQESIQVVDVTGAGDSLAAGVALVLGRGFELVSQLDRLNLIGGKTVSSRNTELPDVDVI